LRYGISIPNFAEPGALLDVAHLADERGWDGFFLWDHIVVDRHDPPPVSEPWTVLAAAATATARVRLGTMVTPVPRRRPWVLARQVTTVDHLSGGRAVLAVGLGVPPEEEYASLGEGDDPRQHGALLDEGLVVIDALWSGLAVRHEGEAHRISDVRFLPQPVQRPRVPIWCAASLPARAGVRRAARWDGVVPIFFNGDYPRPLTPSEVADVVEDVAARQGGRTAAGYEVVVWAVAPDAGLRRDYEEAGATWLIEGPAPGPAWLDDARAIARAGPPLT
jgi:alkanesulfonate monooxygenase SsuD/methylene tetrahydromethanopterin reductase-like flavin-dependent oxidoreductase (luciferase family)